MTLVQADRGSFSRLHDKTIKQFAFALFHFSHASKTDLCGLFALMIPQSSGDTIPCFALANNETWGDTPNLTVGHAPLPFGCPWTSGSRSFALGCHTGTSVISLFLVRLFLYPSSGTSTTMRSSTSTPSWARWRWAGGLGRGVVNGWLPSSFVDHRYRIGVRDISNTLSSSKLLAIHSANPTVTVILSVDHRRHHHHPHQTKEGTNWGKGERVLGGVIPVVYQQPWDVYWELSQSTW